MSNDPEFLTANEAANLLRVTPVTMRNWRAASEGPPWFRVGPRAIRYSRASLLEYVGRFEQDDMREQPAKKRGRPKGSKNKPTLKKLKADLRRVMMKHRLSMPDLRFVMSAFGIEKLSDLPTDRYPDFVATLIALEERYVALAAE